MLTEIIYFDYLLQGVHCHEIQDVDQFLLVKVWNDNITLKTWDMGDDDDALFFYNINYGQRELGEGKATFEYATRVIDLYIWAIGMQLFSRFINQDEPIPRTSDVAMTIKRMNQDGGKYRQTAISSVIERMRDESANETIKEIESLKV